LLLVFKNTFMKTPNKILNFISNITRKLKYHRKLNQLYKHLNKISLLLGAEPIMTAKMKDGTTMLVDLSTRTERVAFYTGQYDPTLIKIVHSLLKPNTYFLDIGANIGFYSISIGNFIRNKELSGKVIAFEPFEGNFKRVLHNIKENNLESFCEIKQYGLSNKSEESQITLREDFKHGSTTGNAAIQTSETMDAGFKLSPIKLKPLDEIWEQYSRDSENIDLIKMDIEGHEDFCLEGGQKTINKHRPTILMEVNKPYYVARNVELDNTFFKLIPKDYYVFREVDSKWKQIQSLNECLNVDNVFLIPVEKLSLEGYQIFESIINID
jgi:FkbM family methyltransferase